MALKAKITQIKLVRAEGLHHEVDRPEYADSFLQANAILRRWSNTAPKCSAYDKCDFWIWWDNGSEYSGRYDLVHHTCEWPDLGRHVRQNLEFLAGIFRPQHMDEKQWAQARRDFAPKADEAKQWLDLHDLTDCQTA